MQTAIVPVAVFPSTANVLAVDSLVGLPPSYRWTLRNGATALSTGNGAITDAQFDAWTTQPTDDFILDCAAANLGVKRT